MNNKQPKPFTQNMLSANKFTTSNKHIKQIRRMWIANLWYSKFIWSWRAFALTLYTCVCVCLCVYQWWWYAANDMPWKLAFCTVSLNSNFNVQTPKKRTHFNWILPPTALLTIKLVLFCISPTRSHTLSLFSFLCISLWAFFAQFDFDI